MNEKDYERFMTKVDKSGDCWLWTDKLNKWGYSTFVLNSKTHNAHRISYIHHYGEITDKLIVRHKCRNRHCVNPAHLETGTHAQNTADRLRDNTMIRGEKSHLHKLTEQQVKEIYISRERNIILAKKYNISSQQISSIKRNDAWEWLKKPEPIIGMDKIILVNGKQVKIRVVPEAMIPSVHVDNTKKKNAFQFYSNPAKTVSPNTIRTYKTQLNNMAKSTGITTTNALIKNPGKVLSYMKTLKPESHGVFLSAIFYELNQPLYDKEDMTPYFKALQPIKMAQITASIAREEDPTKKSKLKEIMEKMKQNYETS